MSSFTDFNLSPALLSSLAKLGYSVPTPIQEKAIPVVLSRKDVLGIAQTGTGKTAAFCLPAIELLLQQSVRKTAPSVLILAPTRELCSQIHSAVEQYAAETSIKSCAVYGGVGQGGQVRAIREGTQIVVATPGRLLDLLEQKLLKLNDIETFVIDEADRRREQGFQEDMQV
jgi:ATP-dependent RNA helicase RhlE